MRKITLLLAASICLCSHDLFLKTYTYQLESYQDTELFLYSGNFDASEGALAQQTLTDTRVVGPNYDFIPNDKAYSAKQDITYLSMTTGEAGTYVAGMKTITTAKDWKAADFELYLEEKGLENVLAERQEQNLREMDANLQHTQYVKAILQIEDEYSAHHAMTLGHDLELVVLTNPYLQTVGDALVFQLLVKGKPIANHPIRYSWRNAETAIAMERRVKTDRNGLVRLAAEASGQWYLSATYLEAVDDKEGNYQSSGATLTFEILE
ncbi:MAG: DUF4198 domain-containing protein [Bacteroidota bacterium]